MRNWVLVTVVVGLAVLLSGCATVYSPVGNGLIVTAVKGPLEATSSEGGMAKVGASSCVNALGVFAVGDASIDAAMKKGGIKKIHHVDHRSFRILGLYSQFETIVHGE